MAVDIKIETFSRDLFSRLWVEFGIRDEVDLNQPNDSCWEDVGLYSIQIIGAVQCRQSIFGHLYREKFAADKCSSCVKSYSDFNDYIRKYFAGSDFVSLTVFEIVFATLAFVSEFTLYFFACCSKDFSKIAHLCWSMYFDVEKKDVFYSSGGWEVLKNVSKSYQRPREFLYNYATNLRNGSFGINRVITSMAEFTKFSELEHIFTGEETMAKDWVDYRLRKDRKYGKSIQPTGSGYDPNTVEGLEIILMDLKKLCDPSGSQVILHATSTSVQDIMTSVCEMAADPENMPDTNTSLPEKEILSVEIGGEEKQEKIEQGHRKVNSSSDETFSRINSKGKQIDYFASLRKSRSLPREKCISGKSNELEVVSNEAKVDEEFSNDANVAKEFQSMPLDLSPRSDIKNSRSISPQNAENQLMLVNKLEEKFRDLNIVQNKEKLDIALIEKLPVSIRVQNQENENIVLDENNLEVNTAQDKENQNPNVIKKPLAISPRQKTDLLTILKEKPDNNQLPRKENQHVKSEVKPDTNVMHMEERILTMKEENDLHQMRKLVYDKLPAVATDNPIKIPSQINIHQSFLDEKNNLSGFKTSNENEVETQIANVCISPVREKETRPIIVNVKALLNDTNLRELDGSVVQDRDCIETDKGGNPDAPEPLKTNSVTGEVDHDDEPCALKTPPLLPDKTEDPPKKNAKKKKRKGGKGKSTLPETRAKEDPDDTKDLLRLMLVLGDRRGIEFVRSTLMISPELRQQKESQKAECTC